jgi:large subunit ribosomal protein L22
MPEWGYSVKALDPDKTVKCAGRELKMSPKAAVEICHTIRGMKIGEAKTLLEQVIKKRLPIAFRRYKKKVAHKSMPEKTFAGRYPVKTADRILRLLRELEANAEYKGLDIENLKIVHAASHRGRKIRAYTPRAFGRASPSFETLSHVEIVGYETS